MDVAMVHEYAVNMVCDKCSEAVHSALGGHEGIQSVTTNVQAQLVVVEGTVASSTVVSLLEDIGRKVKLIGSGCATAIAKGVLVIPAQVGRSGENSAAVVEFKGAATGHGAMVGVVRFVGLANPGGAAAASEGGGADAGPWVHAEVTMHGLAAETDYSVELHEYGDISRGAASTGGLFAFGVVGGSARSSDADGRLEFACVESGTNVWELIGRSLVVKGAMDGGGSELQCAPVGRPELSASLVGGDGLASVIARSAGVGA
jgi:copper chaperone for superoxide dismutase